MTKISLSRMWLALLPYCVVILGLSALFGLWQATDMFKVATVSMTALALFGIWLMARRMSSLEASLRSRTIVFTLIALFAGIIATIAAEISCLSATELTEGCTVPFLRRGISILVFLTLPMILPMVVTLLAAYFRKKIESNSRNTN